MNAAMTIGILLALGGIAAILVGFAAGPFVVSAYRAYRKNRRKRRVSAPRKIPLAAEALEGRQTCAEGGHERDRDRVRPDGKNGYNSVCRRCGAPMHRPRRGEWSVVGSA